MAVMRPWPLRLTGGVPMRAWMAAAASAMAVARLLRLLRRGRQAAAVRGLTSRSLAAAAAATAIGGNGMLMCDLFRVTVSRLGPLLSPPPMLFLRTEGNQVTLADPTRAPETSNVVRPCPKP